MARPPSSIPDDEYSNAANPSGGYSCPPSSSNSSGCDHTRVATQVSGAGVYYPVDAVRDVRSP